MILIVFLATHKNNNNKSNFPMENTIKGQWFDRYRKEKTLNLITDFMIWSNFKSVYVYRIKTNAFVSNIQAANK